MGAKTTPSQFNQVPRQNEVAQEPLHDNYKAKDKNHTWWIACSNCAAVYQDRRKQPRISRAAADGKTCPACHRIDNDATAGFLILQGGFFLTHREEVKQIILDLAARERNERPHKRIIDVKDGAHITLITTTDIDFTRRIGEALQATYQGCLTFVYNKEKNLIDVNWQC